MYLINKPIDAIEEADIQNLRINKVAEHKLIDYKEALPGNSDGDKKEFLFDVSSFANAAGGDLVFGIKEIAGVPTEICGLQINPDAEIRRLESMIQSGIAPRIPGITLRDVPLQTGRTVLIMRIPNSWAGPHMVTFAGSSKFYSRNTKGKYPLDVAELRAAFVLSETVAERIKNFRMERLGRIVAGETPAKLEEPPIVILHIVPIRAFDPMLKTDLSPLVTREARAWLNPIGTGATYLPQYNFDGLFTHSRGTKEADAYVQLFRNGIIESVTTMITSSSREKWLPSTAIEREIIEALPSYLRVQKHIGIDPPVFIMLTFFGVAGYALGVSDRFRFHQTHPIDRDTLFIPEVLLESFGQMPDQILRPIFDVIWNSAGWARSMNYDETGQWKPKT